MKKNRKIVLFVIILFVGLAMSPLGLYMMRDQEITDRKEIYGSWEGFTNDRFDYYRLRFDPDGTGKCAVCFLCGEAELYNIKKWELKGKSMNLILTGSGICPEEPEEIEMSGFAVDYMISVRVKGRNMHKSLILTKDKLINKVQTSVRKKI